MKPTEHRDRMNASFCGRRTSTRLLLRESLMRTRLIVEPYVLRDNAPEVILLEDEHVVQQLVARQNPSALFYAAQSYR